MRRLLRPTDPLLEVEVVAARRQRGHINGERKRRGFAVNERGQDLTCAHHAKYRHVVSCAHGRTRSVTRGALHPLRALSSVATSRKREATDGSSR
jgi:hypothetical protein